MLSEEHVRQWLCDHPSETQAIIKDFSATTTPDPSSTASFSENDTNFKTSKSNLASSPDFFFDVARIVYSSLDLETTIEGVLSIAVQVIQAEKCSVFLLDKETNELWATAWDVTSQNQTLLTDHSGSKIHLSVDGFIENDEEFLQKTSNHESFVSKAKPSIRIPVGKGIAGTVASTRRGLNIKDAYKGMLYK